MSLHGTSMVTTKIKNVSHPDVINVMIKVSLQDTLYTSKDS